MQWFPTGVLASECVCLYIMDSLSFGNAGILGSFQNGHVTQQLFVLTANYAITLTHKAAVWPTTEANEVYVFVCVCLLDNCDCQCSYFCPVVT